MHFPLLGSSITFTALRGFWPPAGVLAGVFLVVHLVALGEQEIGQIGPVLTGYAGYQRSFFHGCGSPDYCFRALFARREWLARAYSILGLASGE